MGGSREARRGEGQGKNETRKGRVVRAEGGWQGRGAGTDMGNVLVVLSLLFLKKCVPRSLRFITNASNTGNCTLDCLARALDGNGHRLATLIPASRTLKEFHFQVRVDSERERVSL